jgi:hypothetical protein
LAAGFIYWYNLPSSAAEVRRIEIWADNAKLDPNQPQNVVGKTKVKIEIKGYYENGNLAPTDELFCNWTFLPSILNNQADPGNKCTFDYQVPLNPNISEQSMLADVIEKGSTARKKLSTSATFILRRDSGGIP